jgi:hypothetical protein
MVCGAERTYSGVREQIFSEKACPADFTRYNSLVLGLGTCLKLENS